MPTSPFKTVSTWAPCWPLQPFWHGARSEFHVRHWDTVVPDESRWQVNLAASAGTTVTVFLVFTPQGAGFATHLADARSRASQGDFQGTHEEALEEACRLALALDAAERLGGRRGLLEWACMACGHVVLEVLRPSMCSACGGPVKVVMNPMRRTS